MGQRTQPSGQRVEGRPLPLDKEERRAVETRAERTQSLAKLAFVGDDEPGGGGRGGGPQVRGQVAERRVLLVADSGDDGDWAVGDRPHEALVAEREQILEAAAAAGEDDDVHVRFAAEICERCRKRGGGAWTLDVRLRDAAPSCREAGRHGGDEVALRGRLVPGEEGDATREERQRPLALGGEEALGGEPALEPLDPGQHGPEAERLDRER